MTDRSLTLSAPAKINLYLGVHTERDDRGYHRVDSLMAAVGLSDTVTVTPAQALTVQTVPASDFPMQKNTAYRAAVAMAEHYGREANICVTIEKRIPLCAGLGGPSTDAAAVIVALAELWGIDRTDPALDDAGTAHVGLHLDAIAHHIGQLLVDVVDVIDFHLFHEQGLQKVQFKKGIIPLR